ncbi:hypothetical protein [Clostridium sp.]|uniref:hypothetical protein n=1 Tax=Clostridium sp. TaxID=1506 RepID=UPI00321780B1
MSLDYFNGMQVVENKLFTKGSIQVPKRKHKKKRIQKKWMKKYGYRNIPIPMDDVYILNNTIYGHPKTIKKILKS